MRKTYRVPVENPVQMHYGLMYSGSDLDEAIDVYEECRLETLLGIDPCDVLLMDQDGKQLARTDYQWTGKIRL